MRISYDYDTRVPILLTVVFRMIHAFVNARVFRYSIDNDMRMIRVSDVFQGERGGTPSTHLFYQGNDVPLPKSNVGERRSPSQG